MGAQEERTASVACARSPATRQSKKPYSDLALNRTSREELCRSGKGVRSFRSTLKLLRASQIGGKSMTDFKGLTELTDAELDAVAAGQANGLVAVNIHDVN